MNALLSAHRRARLNTQLITKKADHKSKRQIAHNPFVLLILIGLLVSTQIGRAQSSATSISFQGALNGANGQPLPNGNYILVFQFWDHPTGTAASSRVGGPVTVPGVAVSSGVASTAIPVQPDWFNGQTRYLGTTIQGVNAGEELLPRVLVTAVPYALNSKHLKAETGEVAFFDSKGRLAINTSSPRDTMNLAPNIEGLSGDYCFLGIGKPSTNATHLSLGVRGLEFGRCEIQAHSREWVPGGQGDLDINPEGGDVQIGNRVRKDSLLVVNGTTRTTVLQITSARAAKEQFTPVDTAAVLAKVAALPITTWFYTNNTGIRHLGPVAEDFHAAFALGDSDKHIATVDADGVAFAAIQGLHQIVTAQQTALRACESEAQSLQQRLEKLELLVTELAEQRKRGGK